MAQTRRVTGKVISAEDSSPVPGAGVIVSGTTVGTVTGMDGTFTLNVPTSAKSLVVSCLGMKTQEVDAQDGIMVVLENDFNALNEVVVTAMGITREKKALGYAIQEVKSDELMAAGAPSVTSALNGKVAGVQINTFGGSVGASSRISVRGNSSLSSNQQPLIVVDGVPINNDTQRTGDNTYRGVDFGSGLNDINPEDIESVSVLKGGSAALYGMRAGNGVILITTKTGKRSGGMEISYDGSITFDRVANIPKLQNRYGQGYVGDGYHYQEYLDGGGTLDRQAYSEANCFTYVDGNWGGVQDGNDESWGAPLDAGLMLVQFDSNGQKAPWVSHPDNVKSFFQTGITQNHMISLQSRSEKSTTRVSLSYRNQTGTIPNTDQSRYGAQFNTQMTLNRFFSFDFSGNYTRTESDNLVNQGYRGNNPINSLVAWSGRQINMQSMKEHWADKDAEGNFTMYNWNTSYHINPYFNVYMNTNSYQRDRMFGKTSLYFNPLDWLKIEGRVGFDYYNSRMFEKTYFELDDPEGAFYSTDIAQTELNADLIASVNKTFGDFNLTAILGANYRDSQYLYEQIGADALVIPGVYTIGNKVGDAVTGMDHSHIRSNSVYGNFSLGFKNMLYLDASARNDWSSTIRDPFFYPSVSLSWIVTESIPGLKQGNILSFWKLRGGVAGIGSATSAYRNSYYYYSAGAAFNGVAQMYKSYTYPNLNLRPEKVTSWEVGTEIGLFDDRLHLDVAYYQKKTEDQILSVTTSNVVGFGSMLVNAGRIDNKGIEVQLVADIFRNNDGFNWTSTLNFARDRSKIVELYPEQPDLKTYTMGWTWGYSTTATIGDAWGDIRGTGMNRITEADVKAGNATADQIGAIKVNSGGFPTTASDQVIGNVSPDAIMGWRNDFSYKNLSFGAMFDFRLGGDIWSQTMSHAYCAGLAAYTVDGDTGDVREKPIVAGKDVFSWEKFVKQDASGKWVTNDIQTNAQDLFEWGNGNVGELATFKGSYLKLRELYLTYQLPKSLMNRAKYIKRASISAIAGNVALLWVDKSNTMRIDPETGGVSSDTRGMGFEQASVPGSRSFGFKLNLTF
jgi:TonB-linked SusC/RagA family outer membrane protein